MSKVAATNPYWLVNTAPRNLKAQIARAIQSGYQVMYETPTTAQLVKKKQFSCLFATLWFLVFGIGFLIYLFWYMAKQDEVIYLDIEAQPKAETGT